MFQRSTADVPTSPTLKHSEPWHFQARFRRPTTSPPWTDRQYNTYEQKAANNLFSTI